MYMNSRTQGLCVGCISTNVVFLKSFTLWQRLPLAQHHQVV